MPEMLLYIFLYALISSLIKIASSARFLPDEAEANLSVAFLTFTELLLSAFGALLCLIILVASKFNQ